MSVALDNALKILPKTSRDIADFLYNKKIQGIRHSYTECPLARYIKKKCRWPHIFVAADYIRQKRKYISLPMHIIAFVADFDQGNYPRLEER